MLVKKRKLNELATLFIYFIYFSLTWAYDSTGKLKLLQTYLTLKPF